MNNSKTIDETLQEAINATNTIFELASLFNDLSRTGGNVVKAHVAEIDHVIFNAPATIVFWLDGSKTVVKAQNGEPFDKEKGLAMAICKKLSGNRGAYYDIFKEWCHEEAAEEEGGQG